MKILGRTLALCMCLAAVGSAAAAGPAAAATYTARMKGMEVLPITATLGTFVGVADGGIHGTWRVAIAHQALSAAPSAAITGGSFSLLAANGRRFGGAVTGGSVRVVNRGARCTNQTYSVVAVLASGSFTGTLIHHRSRVFGRCVAYFATVTGRATLAG